MSNPTQVLEECKKRIKKEWTLGFGAAFVIGLLVHMPVLLSDIPNHDGLASMYFDQNMITSGRWFLTVACGFSSYFTLPWVIGLLGLFFLSLTSAALVELLEIKNRINIVLVGGLLVTFPSLTSTFAYVFTLDGYMLALLLAVLAVLLTKKYKYGFGGGALCLAFSMGIYQAYLPFAILLCIYVVVLRIIENGSAKEKIKYTLHFLYMGIGGIAAYFVILHALLFAQGKELANYQGINNLDSGLSAGSGLPGTVKEMYHDFLAFTLKGNVLVNNVFSAVAAGVLILCVICVLVKMLFVRKWWKKPIFFVIIALLAGGLPIATNFILFISPDVTYHLLMRYQWVVYPILMLAFVERYGGNGDKSAWLEWGVLCGAFILLFNYAITDNIGYSNMQKRYEKTYAYCLRLLDRIEQTEGYYQGIPIAMIGVVGDEEYPMTDITQKITSGMIGVGGDSLLYTSANYEAFMKHYLGATLNFLEPDAMQEIYFSEEYVAMESFPGATSTKVVDGILYVKTENSVR